MILIVFGVTLSATMTGADEPATLKKCRAQEDRLDKEVKDKEKDLATLKEKIKKLGEKIARYQRVNNKWGNPVDKVRKEIRELKNKLAKEKRKGGGLVGTGQNTRMDRFVTSQDSRDERIAAKKKEIEEKENEEKDLIRKAEKAIEKELGELLNFREWRIDLTALMEKQAEDKDIKRNKEVTLARIKDDLARKRKECQVLAQSIQKPDTGQTGSGKEVVTFIGGIQIPTPKSGMDLPIEDEVEPNLEDTWEYFPLMQIFPKDPGTKAYYEALKEDFKLFLPGVKVPSDPSLFSRSGAEFATLFENSKKAGWKNTPIRPYHGAYLVFVDCSRHYRFRLHVVRPGTRSTYGGIHVFGLKPGRHPVRVIIATEDGQRFEANFALVVTHKPEKRTALEMGPDGIVREKPNAITVDLNYLKKTFRKLWGDHLQDRAQAQAQKNRDVLRATLEGDVHLVYNYVQDMKNQPGCTVDDVDPLLGKGGDAVTLLFTQFGTDPNDHVPWEEMLRFAKLCKRVGSRKAYDVLAALVRQAANSASKTRQDTLGYAYELLGEIAFMQGRFHEALPHLNTGLEYHKQANPNYPVEKGRAELPSIDQLKFMLSKLTG